MLEIGAYSDIDDEIEPVLCQVTNFLEKCITYVMFTRFVTRALKCTNVQNVQF